MTDFSTLKISEVILHRIPHGTRVDGDPDTIIYSGAPVQQNAQDKNFIEKRLSDVLSGYARPVVEDTSISIQTPDQIRALLGGSGDPIVLSSELALSLHAMQKKISPPGLFMVIEGTLEGERCLILTKIQPQEGMRMEPTVIGGKATFSAQYLRDLVFGEKTKVYKVGVFRASGAIAGNKLAGDVVDPQQGGGDVADFFVEFLGCKFVHRPDWQTQQFFKVAQRLVARVAKSDPDTATDYQMAVLAEMRSPASKLSPEDFANHHIKVEHRDDFLGQVISAGVPRREFTKDIRLVRNQVRRVQINTVAGATVLAPQSMYNDGLIRIETSKEDGVSEIVIRDKVAKILGGNGPKKSESGDNE